MVERKVTESSSENSEVCMQELVSPFRQMKLGRDQGSMSPDERSNLIQAS